MKILLAVDGSPDSQKAVSELVARPWPSKSTVRVLTAVPRYQLPMVELVTTGETPIEVRADYERSAANLTKTVADSLKSTELSVETSVRHGDPPGHRGRGQRLGCRLDHHWCTRAQCLGTMADRQRSSERRRTRVVFGRGRAAALRRPRRAPAAHGDRAASCETPTLVPDHYEVKRRRLSRSLPSGTGSETSRCGA